MIRIAISKQLRAILHLALGGLLFPTAQTVFAQTNAARPLPANRWLLVVETSRSMEVRGQAAQEMVNRLLTTGMNGQMRPGDTIGVWTYNADLYARSFDLQTWTPATSRTVARHVAGFLMQQKYQKEGRFEKVMPALQTVLRNSDFITVVLISDGQEKMRGTPFDDEINKYYATWSSEQEKARLPFLTLLRAERDKITAYTVNAPPWPLELPPLPSALQPPKPAQAVAAAPPQAVVFTGKKPAPTPTQEIVQLPPAVPETPITASNLLAPSETIPGRPTAPSAAISSVPEPSQPTPVAKPSTVSSGDVKPNEPSRRPAETTAVPTAAPADATSSRHGLLPNEMVVAARADPNAISTPPASTTNAVVPRTARAPSTPAVTAIPPRTFSTGKWFWIVSAACLAGIIFVVVAVLLARRRARSPLHVSLITRSLDGKKK